MKRLPKYMNRSIYLLSFFVICYMVTPLYSQSSKSRTHSSKNSKNTPTHAKSVAVKSTNSPKKHRTNKQWKTNSTLGMFSNWPSKTNKPSSQRFDMVKDNDDESDQIDDEKPSGLEKKEKESFWEKFKLFKKE
ncbi:MAG: hypothetical protein VX530_02810 [Candidatus Neomarinimicrobiota bacterium]|nr:hypothetical protein [Candidatus Neomarinimicrobiota bacterium]